jgi:hypothetical protein
MQALILYLAILFCIFLAVTLNMGMAVDLQVEKITSCWKEGKDYKVELYFTNSVKDITCMEYK